MNFLLGIVLSMSAFANEAPRTVKCSSILGYKLAGESRSLPGPALEFPLTFADGDFMATHSARTDEASFDVTVTPEGEIMISFAIPSHSAGATLVGSSGTIGQYGLSARMLLSPSSEIHLRRVPGALLNSVTAHCGVR